MTTKSKLLKRIFRLYLMVVGTVFWIMPRNSIWLFDSSLAQVLSQYRYLKTLSTFRQVQKRRRLSKRRKSTTSEWMSSKSFFACGKDVSLVSLFLFQIFYWKSKKQNLNIDFQKPEYLRGAPTSTYKSAHDISKLPDEVFEQA